MNVSNQLCGHDDRHIENIVDRKMIKIIQYTLERESASEEKDQCCIWLNIHFCNKNKFNFAQTI
jgi:hypothetical protein